MSDSNASGNVPPAANAQTNAPAEGRAKSGAAAMFGAIVLFLVLLALFWVLFGK